MTRELVGAAVDPVERLASAPRAGWPSGLTAGVATRSRSGSGIYNAWATGVVVHMQTLLALVVVWAIIRPAVVMMA